MPRIRFLVALLLAASSASAQDSETGTMDHPMHLDCKTLGAVIAARRGEGSVVAGSLTVMAEDDAAVPPVILGCAGQRHIVCVMETPSGAQPARLVGIAGRISAVGSNYVMVDPCGVRPAGVSAD